jgi:hypothetical protein
MGEPARTPDEVAEQLAAEAPDQAWLRALTDRLDELLGSTELDRLLSAWDLSLSEASRMFGVSRQALAKWRSGGVPADRMPALTDLVSATRLLERRIKRERIPAVIRRRAEALGGRSLLEIARAGEHAAVLEAVERMFDLRRVQP